MPDYVVAPPPVPAVTVAGTAALFPVRTVYAFTGTYGARADLPAVFTKAPQTVVPSGSRLPYPPETDRLEPEIELVVAIGSRAANLADAEAAREVAFGYAVGLDMTRRDIQRAARNEGKPWDMAKTFDGASPIAAIHRASDIGHPERGTIMLNVNGARAQLGDLAEMAWTPLALTAMLSKVVTLYPGDLIFTGTPSGEAQLRRGDVLHGRIVGLTDLNASIV